ncbi:uncharacterized protein ACHE_11470S [Aspergillus chevalieri]|uniref:Erythromycin esterase n=1 Tax=Aspergillus chevalieri TaxID=182096 RepID=A0A7R7VHS3_ASPCH|nr:uncharacterized protein ACHE_11470S [Aspergillus chevalieri]BCR84068.1 hypothetical protein ACHE_11470S [Aspergillus chevalieri]
MAVRRSARLRARSSEEPEPQTEPVPQIYKNENATNNETKLPPVMEHDEPQPPEPVQKTPVRNSTVNETPNKTPKSEKKPSEHKTPTSTAATRPPMGEMHPSKVHQSTTKKVDSGLILGFNPVKKDANGKVVKDTVVENTPTKAKASPASQYGTPGFEFKFACQESELSDEAKKLMESVREDVARIKAQMIQDKQAQEQSGDNTHEGDRRIAQPKGRAGRYDDAHMAEFKKMDSIAGHASAFRAAPGRFKPVDATKTLKRTKSKARLDESESQNNSPSKATPSKATLCKPSPAPAAGAKRVKHDRTDDASTRRPSKEDAPATTAPATTPRRTIDPLRRRTAVRGSLMTPTRSSMARASSASVKPPKKPSMIPGPTQSPVSKPLAAPRTPQTEFNPRLKTNLPSFANLKSILRRREPLFSKDPAKIAAGTHSAAPDFTPDLLFSGIHGEGDKEDVAQTPSPKKRVGFSPSVKSPNDLPPASPSPSKIPTSTRPASDITYPTLPALTPEKAATSNPGTPSIRHVRPSTVTEDKSLIPEVPGVMHGINNKKRHRVEPDEADTENVPPADSTTNANASDERSAKRVKPNTPVKRHQPPTPSPVKAPAGTPLRSASKVSRPSGAPGSVSRTGTGTGTPGSMRKNRFMTSSRLNMLAQPKHR